MWSSVDSINRSEEDASRDENENYNPPLNGQNNSGSVVTVNGNCDNSDHGGLKNTVIVSGDTNSSDNFNNNNNNKYISIIDVNGSDGDNIRPPDDISIVQVNSRSSEVSDSYETGNGVDSDQDYVDSEDEEVEEEAGSGADKVDAVIRRTSIPGAREKLKRQRSGSGGEFWGQQDELLSPTEDACIVDFLDKSNYDAEARLAAKRQARAEAREIRMRELERQQKETEDTSDKIYDSFNSSDGLNKPLRVSAIIASPRNSSVLSGGNNSYHSSRRSSEDSLEETTSLRDIRLELKELEDKFRKAMIANAQLDNEKASASYQLELYKDRLEELDEQHSQLQREHKEKCRQFEALKRATKKLQEDLELTRAQLDERDRLIEEQGLVIVGGEYSSSEEEISDDGDHNTKTSRTNNNNNSKSNNLNNKRPPKRALVSAQVAGALQKVGEGSLDVRLKKFVEHSNELSDELSRVKLELEEERARNRGQRNSLSNGSTDDLEDIQREANKLLGDYKFKLQKAEQDVSTLQANVTRLESQVVRYKASAEASEKVEDDLKVEKRKLLRELREALGRVEELETANSHLQKRLDKLKNAKSNLLKEL